MSLWLIWRWQWWWRVVFNMRVCKEKHIYAFPSHAYLISLLVVSAETSHPCRIWDTIICLN
jgi:hypothetical protein